jgi:DNA-binding HxlR family transcriptional regulator
MTATDPVRPTTVEDERVCTIARVLGIVGDKWTLRILCEAALNDVSRFTDFQDLLGIATDVLAQRLAKLVDEGLLTKEPYKEPGSRARFRYELTPAGTEMRLVLAALQQWGDVHRPSCEGVTEVGRTKVGDRPVRVEFVDDTNTVVPADAIAYRYSL